MASPKAKTKSKPIPKPSKQNETLPALELKGENIPDLVFQAVRAGCSPIEFLSKAAREEALRFAGEGNHKPMDLIELALQVGSAHAINLQLRVLVDEAQPLRTRLSIAKDILDRRSYVGERRTVQRTLVEIAPDTLDHIDKMAGIIEATSVMPQGVEHAGIIEAESIPAQAQALIEQAIAANGEIPDA